VRAGQDNEGLQLPKRGLNAGCPHAQSEGERRRGRSRAQSIPRINCRAPANPAISAGHSNKRFGIIPPPHCRAPHEQSEGAGAAGNARDQRRAKLQSVLSGEPGLKPAEYNNEK
jgi:hypothetical protein